jgi:acyl-CoA synthetase (AMP-forming)/AMP-acid ligase II
VLSAGAPVMPHVLETMLGVIHSDGQMHTPYGATEALPVASIAAREVLGEPKQAWQRGAGICVGRRFAGIEWKIIRCADGPIRSIEEAEELVPGTIGELIVRGPVVTREYVTRVEWNERSKIADATGFWHRMGDVGHLDAQDRFWFCGRAAHRVMAVSGPMYTIPCEAIFNQHPQVFRSALVGIGEPGKQRPVIVCEPRPGQMPRSAAARQSFCEELRRLAVAHEHTGSIKQFLFHPSFPVDIRHNAKIFREKLAVWAARQLASR